jgi:hypothetical protein
MLVTTQSRTFCLLICCLKTQILEYTKKKLPVVLYRYETWSFTVREENRLRVFQNMFLRRIFGLKRDNVLGG